MIADGSRFVPHADLPRRLPALDRCAERRKDAAWLGERLGDATARVLVMCGTRHLVYDGGECPTVVALPVAELPALGVAQDELIFLGVMGEAPYFAARVALECEAVACEAGGGEAGAARFAELRSVAATLPAAEMALLGYARALAWWHERHRFCAVCGQPSVSADAGHVRRCSDGACGATHFPRTDPAVIALVTHGDACLLGNAPAWSPTMYSALAGFVEPGESLEDALRRELFEEVGVRVRDVRYRASQPWPFPQSLMVAFVAEAEARDLTIDTTELRDARWFTRDELRAALASGTVAVPSEQSIARWLIDRWLQAVPDPPPGDRQVGDRRAGDPRVAEPLVADPPPADRRVADSPPGDPSSADPSTEPAR